MADQEYQYVAPQGMRVSHMIAASEGACAASVQDFGTYASGLGPLRTLPDQPIQTDITMCEGLFVKLCTFKAGTFIPQHSHETDHLSLIAHGAVMVWEEGVYGGTYTAPAGIVIKARVKHMFQALEDGTTIACVHRVDDGDEPHVHELHEVRA